jgi:hypothetical protein
MLTREKLKSKPIAKRPPHVVILGAGASKAAMPEGDKSGKAIPLMEDLPEILGNDWKRLVHEAEPPQGNFEATFSWIRKNGNFESQLSEIQKSIESYFQDLELPDHPTIYDYLVLGLRGKDVLATFNWDPFLMQAHKRNRKVAELPDIRFLHGCVAFATCTEHDILGEPFGECPECQCHLDSGRLFFPDEDKDYAQDALTYRDWEKVTAKLKKAFHLTVFGYSGPATDYNARKLLLDGWKQSPMQPISHAEIIDIKEKDILINSWGEFFPYSHYMIFRNFWDSSVAKWPRRTFEWKSSVSRYGIPVQDIGPLRTHSLNELQEWFGLLAATESDIQKTEDS